MKKIFIILSAVVVLFIIAIIAYMAHVGSYRKNVQTSPGQTAGWQILKNDIYGFEMKYPAGFNSKYASFAQIPTIIVTVQGNAKIDSNGCYVADGANPSKDSQIIVNNLSNMSFCLSTSSDPGAGQLYNTSNYTIYNSGIFYTLEYVVHTLNGCSAYMNTPDYNSCTDFMNNYDSIVNKAIKDSVATFKFKK